jgi:hypothetical protein
MTSARDFSFVKLTSNSADRARQGIGNRKLACQQHFNERKWSTKGARPQTMTPLQSNQKAAMSFLAQYQVSQTSPIVDASFDTLEDLTSKLGSMHRPGFGLCFVYEDGERLSNERFVDVVVAMMIAYLKTDAAKRLKFYVHSGITTDQLVDRALYKRYGQSASAEVARNRDCTHLIERFEVFEDRLGVAFSALRAEICDSGSQIEVMGQMQTRGEPKLMGRVEVVIDALDQAGRVLDTTETTSFFPENFFAFATFKQALTLEPARVSRIRVYPKGVEV